MEFPSCPNSNQTSLQNQKSPANHVTLAVPQFKSVIQSTLKYCYMKKRTSKMYLSNLKFNLCVSLVFILFLMICRTKSRIEAINEIIAKSESHANQMLASGTFNLNPLAESTFKVSGSHLGGHVQVPNSQYWNLTSKSSPRAEHNRSISSDDGSLNLVNGSSSK